MISDVLSQMITELDSYLCDPTFDRVYRGEMRGRLIKLYAEAVAIRAQLDDPPPGDLVE